ncbi:Gfo/Idh/MocA family protein [Marinoscillum sp.]|uniref:Gfo/Idh/MocA family protein n=1 Tax=Marinoscillum sp. TaxID=2024838 RepID=UPI003BAD8F7D
MKVYRIHSYLFLMLFLSTNVFAKHQPLRVGVIGLTHTHVHWIFGSEERGDIEIVGIVETNKELAQRYADQQGYSMDLVFDSMEELIQAKKPEAVTAFGTIYEHLAVVEKCAPLGIHVMVEKPLAVNLEHARKMADLANRHNIHLLTNYETTWYPTNHKAYKLVKKENTIGDIRKIVVRDGHKGPKKIGINSEFLDWLTDPKENGGGAVIDFGCYGANLATWLMDGKRPKSVTAITTQLQPENNPEVDDEAIILLEYAQSVVVIHGSWNWPIGRKDMEIYGLTGVVYADNRHDLRVRISEGYDGFNEEAYELEERSAPLDDPFSYFAAVVRGDVAVRPTDLSALENNMVVMEILDAAIRSANNGEKVVLK